MLSEASLDIERIEQDDLSKEKTLRVAIIAELDAINLYEEMVNPTDNEDIKNVLLEIAKEEK